jgi:Leu/Phe-tRNA-protein transferase
LVILKDKRKIFYTNPRDVFIYKISLKSIFTGEEKISHRENFSKISIDYSTPKKAVNKP